MMATDKVKRLGSGSALIIVFTLKRARGDAARASAHSSGIRQGKGTPPIAARAGAVPAEVRANGDQDDQKPDSGFEGAGGRWSPWAHHWFGTDFKRGSRALDSLAIHRTASRYEAVCNYGARPTSACRRDRQPRCPRLAAASRRPGRSRGLVRVRRCRSRLTTTDFPSRWTVEELEACFVVVDSDGQKVAFIYHWDEPGQRVAAKLPTKEQARQIAANIARLPDLLRSLQAGTVRNAQVCKRFHPITHSTAQYCLRVFSHI